MDTTREIWNRKAASAQRKILFRQCFVEEEAVFLYPNGFNAKISDSQNSGGNLPQNPCHHSAHHTPAEHKDDNRFQKNVDKRPGQCGGYGKFRTAVRADDGVERLTKQVAGDAQSDPEEILLGLIVDLSTEQDQDRLLKEQVDCRQHRIGCDAQQYDATNALMGGIPVAAAQTDADEGTVTVPDQ